MITGYVNQHLEPIVAVDLVDDNGFRWRREVIIDTGFNGDLTLPSEFIHQLGLTLVGLAGATLADGQMVVTNQYQATAVWDGQHLTVDVLESTNQLLLGTSMVEGRTLTVQMWEGGDVVIH